MSLHLNFNTLRPRRNRRDFADDIFKRISLNEDVLISIKISLKFIPKSPINNIPALVQIMAWRRPGDKPLSEAMMIISLTHICVTRPQWVKYCHSLGMTWKLVFSSTKKNLIHYLINFKAFLRRPMALLVHSELNHETRGCIYASVNWAILDTGIDLFGTSSFPEYPASWIIVLGILGKNYGN